MMNTSSLDLFTIITRRVFIQGQRIFPLIISSGKNKVQRGQRKTSRAKQTVCLGVTKNNKKATINAIKKQKRRKKITKMCRLKQTLRYFVSHKSTPLRNKRHYEIFQNFQRVVNVKQSAQPMKFFLTVKTWVEFIVKHRISRRVFVLFRVALHRPRGAAGTNA